MSRCDGKQKMHDYLYDTPTMQCGLKIEKKKCEIKPPSKSIRLESWQVETYFVYIFLKPCPPSMLLYIVLFN